MKTLKLGMGLCQCDVGCPQFQPIVQLLTPLAAGTTEELVVASDLGLEARLGLVQPATFLRKPSQGRQGWQVLPIDDDPQIDWNLGGNQRVDACGDTSEGSESIVQYAPLVVNLRRSI